MFLFQLDGQAGKLGGVFLRGSFQPSPWERHEAAEPGHFICCFLLALSELSLGSCGPMHVRPAGLVCWLYFSFPVKGFLPCKFLYMKASCCAGLYH